METDLYIGVARREKGREEKKGVAGGGGVGCHSLAPVHAE